MIKKTLLILALTSVCYAGDYTETIGPMGTLDNTHPSVTIPNSTAQDLLNVDVTPGGKSIKKRRGYAAAFTLSNATSPVHGTYIFYDANADVALYFNDTKMNVSVGGLAPTVFFSTGPNGATYQCVDGSAFAYCANTSRTSIVKVNSTTYSLLTNVNSTGTILAITPERLVMAGFSEAPSRIDFSKPNDFATWAVGATNATGLQITVTAPGSKITHLAYAHGRIYWFKDSSFGYVIIGPTDSNAVAGTGWQVVTVNNAVGTIYNTSIFRDDILYFQGQDGHFYAWDGTNLVKLSTNIQASITQTQGRSSNARTLTTQTDFELGFSSSDISTTQLAGSVIAKSTWYVFTSSTDFGSDYLNPVLLVDTQTVSGNLQLTFPDEFVSMRNGTNGTKPVWSQFGTAGNTSTVTSGMLSMSGTNSGTPGGVVNVSSFPALASGTTFSFILSTAAGGTSMPSIYVSSIGATSLGTNATDGRNLFGIPLVCTTAGCSHDNQFLPNGGNHAVEGVTSPLSGCVSTSQNDTTTKNRKFPTGTTEYFYVTTSSFQVTAGTTTVAFGTHTCGLNPLFVMAFQLPSLSATTAAAIDHFGVFPQTFTATTPGLDTGIIYPLWSTFTVVSTGNGTISHTSQSSADNITFNSAVTASSGSALTSSPQRYVKLNTFFSAPNSTDVPTSMSSFNIIAGSSGSYLSVVNNAPNITSWDAFNSNTVQTDGTITFYVRAATGAFTVTSSTPAWTLTTANSIPTISTNPYFQERFDFIARSSNTVRLDDFTFNWFEGAATDKTYALYHDNSLWWAVASGTGASTNNKIFKYDLLNQGWLIYNIPMNGIYERSQDLYFGAVDAGKIYKFGDVDSDNGTAINAYWKSKDFFGTNPFLDKSYMTLSVFAGSVASSSMTVTYTINGSSATNITMPLYDGSHSFLRFNKNLPPKVGNTINVQFGNNAVDQSFEIYGIQIGTNEKPWSAQ